MNIAKKNNFNIQNIISELLKKYCIDPKKKGYNYIFFILEYCIEYNCFPNRKTYIAIANKLSVNSSVIYRYINSIISQVRKQDFYLNLEQEYGTITPTKFISILYGELMTKVSNPENDVIINILKKYHLMSNSKGYEYIFYILKYCLKNNFTPHNQIVNSIYPLVAKEFNTTISSVERAIRYSIEQTSNYDSYANLVQLYNHISNALFISVLYNELTIDNYII